MNDVTARVASATLQVMAVDARDQSDAPQRRCPPLGATGVVVGAMIGQPFALGLEIEPRWVDLEATHVRHVELLLLQGRPIGEPVVQ